MPDPTTYPMVHASPRRDCAIPVVSQARGTITWSIEHRVAARDAQVLIWEGAPVVVGEEAVALVHPDGTLAWDRAERLLGSPVVVGKGLLFTWTGLELRGLDRDGAIVEQDAAPPLYAGGGLVLGPVWPREREVLAVISLPNPQYDSEDPPDPLPRPELRVLRVPYGERFSTWSASFEGVEQLRPLYLEGQGRLLLAIDDDLLIVDPAGAAEPVRRARPAPLVRNAYPADHNVDWSADRDGTLVLLASTAGRRFATAFDVAGRVLWRWDDAGADPWTTGQPPARGPAGRTYVLTATRVLALDGGVLAWEHPLEAPARATALADGALLVTAGPSLLRLEADGAVTFTVNLPAEITGSPVVGPEGAIYVATAGALARID